MKFVKGATAVSMEGRAEGGVKSVTLDNGSVLPADTVVVRPTSSRSPPSTCFKRGPKWELVLSLPPPPPIIFQVGVGARPRVDAFEGTGLDMAPPQVADI